MTPPPSNRDELARFLGMIKYLARFLPDLSERSYHLRVLMKADVHFQWGPEQQRAFEDIKSIVSSEPVLQFYDPELPKKISCDASQKGLGAVLQQLHGNEWRPVAYASKSTTDCQTRYAPIEREALAVEFTCGRFHKYIFGQTVEVESDSKPLVAIFSKVLNYCPPRIQRLRLKLQKYDLKLAYVPGKYMYTADTLSRPNQNENNHCQNRQEATNVNMFTHSVVVASVLASISRTQQIQRTDFDLEIEEHLNGVINSLSVTDRKKEQIKKGYEDDTDMCALKDIIMSGWPKEQTNLSECVQQYWNYRDEMTVQNGLILKGTRIVIPKKIKLNILEILHTGHLGQ